MTVTSRAAGNRPETIRIDRRFRGPSNSGNGGYTAGVVAGLLDAWYAEADAIEVTLRKPPPLDADMDVSYDDGVVRVCRGDVLVAEACAAQLDLRPLPPVAYDVAASATAEYPGHTDHPFPECFACGTAREPGDGLRVHPGLVDPRSGLVAAPWTPDRSLADETAPGIRREFVWAALDCIGAWSVDVPGRTVVVGRITGRVDRPPAVGERCVVLGWPIRQEGRRSSTGTAVYSDDGRLVGLTQQEWFEVDPVKVVAPE
jgi:hypothetical protein